MLKLKWLIVFLLKAFPPSLIFNAVFLFVLIVVQTLVLCVSLVDVGVSCVFLVFLSVTESTRSECDETMLVLSFVPRVLYLESASVSTRSLTVLFDISHFIGAEGHVIQLHLKHERRRFWSDFRKTRRKDL